LIDEVLNPEMGLLKNRGLVEQWFPYIPVDEERPELECEIRDILGFSPFRDPRRFFRLAAILYSHSRPISVNYSTYLRLVCRFFTFERSVVKDPIALFCAPWMARKFDMQVVLLLRHPAAFVASLRRMGWRFDFSNFLCQKSLMSDHLSAYGPIFEKSSDMDSLTEASLLWLALYTVADDYITQHPEWLVRRHEDISADPVMEFQKLYGQLGIEWTDYAAAAVKRYSSGPGEVPRGLAHYQMRDSRTNIKGWRERLAPDEVARIREITSPIAERYYSNDDW